MKTQGLRQALDLHGFDAAFGGARRDEEASRAKERVFSFRSEGHRWNPRKQRPEMWRLLNGRLGSGETARVFPLSNWTEKDVWRYIAREQLDVVPLYFAAERPTVERNGSLLVLDDDRMPLRPGETVVPAPGSLSHAGLLAADGSHRVRGRRSRQRHRRNAVGQRFRAPGAAHRPRRSRRHGAQEAGGIFLMTALAEVLDVEERPGPLPRRPSLVRAAATASPQHLAGSLHVLTCGSVDDGKSTLIGRLLWDAGALHTDQRQTLQRSAKTAAGTPDFSLLVDGLAAEREQGITIDIAWRYFDTSARRLVIIDSPGHEQYTRNMATGASHADVAILLVDARTGVKVQTRRHAAILGLMGVARVVLAVNKMDLVDWSEARFRDIEAEFLTLAERFGFSDAVAIPVSAVLGDNIAQRSTAMRWYAGPLLLDHLQQMPARQTKAGGDFRFPVQMVVRAGQDFRGLAGTVASGDIGIGDEVVDALSGAARARQAHRHHGPRPRTRQCRPSRRSATRHGYRCFARRRTRAA